MKTRIVKRTGVDGGVSYVIQQKSWLWWWIWIDAFDNYISSDRARCYNSTLERAKANLCYFDGSRSTEEIVHESK